MSNKEIEEEDTLTASRLTPAPTLSPQPLGWHADDVVVVCVYVHVCVCYPIWGPPPPSQ